jgi:chromosomal replication initiator protein
VADWLKNRYSELICEAIREVNGHEQTFDFNISKGEDITNQTEIEFYSRPAVSISTSNNGYDGCLNERYSFDNLVVGGFNQFAHAAALAVAEAPGATNYNPLFIYGGTGLGKTHLAHAIGRKVISNFSGKKVMYASSEKFTSDFISSISNGTIESFTSKYRTVDVLLIDDIQFFSGKESTQEQFFHTFNDLYQAGKQIVLTSDRHPNETRGLEERLLSRFSSGLIVDLQPPDLETRVAILRMRTENEKPSFPESVLYFIADNVTSNIRELEGCLTRLLAYASLNKTEIDLDSAQKILGKEILKSRRELTARAIQKKTAEIFRVDVAMMVAKKKTAQIALSRQVAMYLCRKYTPLSLKSIGDAFGGRDHSTVIHACDLISRKMEQDSELKLKVENISSALMC